MVCAVLPIKDLVRAKSRLAGVLGPSERRSLAQAMAEDVLDELAAHPGVTRVVLVSDDPGAELLARVHRADCWREAALGGGGLNAVLQAACARLRNLGVRSCMVLHADLPLFGGADLEAVLELMKTGDVIGPDRARLGTNLLAFDTGRAPRFRFGEGSCPLHLRDALARGAPLQPLERPGIALDIDEPQDLRDLLGELGPEAPGRTARFLHGEGLATRLALALAEIDAAGTHRDARGEGAC